MDRSRAVPSSIAVILLLALVWAAVIVCVHGCESSETATTSAASESMTLSTDSNGGDVDDEAGGGLFPAPISESGKWGYVDRTGTMAIELQFGSTAPFSDGLGQVMVIEGDDYSFGYVDTTGKVIRPREDPASAESALR
jgi:hypothetical protein